VADSNTKESSPVAKDDGIDAIRETSPPLPDADDIEEEGTSKKTVGKKGSKATATTDD
jgi:hypothetical protein